MRRLPTYAWIGLLLMVVSQGGLLAGIEPFASWHTPIAWTGYLLLVDGIVWKRRGNSWIRDSPTELLFLAALSVPLWVVFEISTVPILPEVKVFEMPILGFGGFPPFAVECFVMYVAVRALLWRGAERPIAV